MALIKADAHSGSRAFATPLLVRHRLNRLFDAGFETSSIVFVTAGAGYGKTQSVQDYLKSCGKERQPWFNLSELDNIAARFWKGYVNLAARFSEEQAQRLDALGMPVTDEQYSTYFTILQEIYNEIPTSMFIIDGLHCITNPDIINFFIRRLSMPIPPKAIVISRSSVNVSFMGFLPTERVFNIKEDALCFTRTEIEDYLILLGIRPNSRIISEILSGTQGWAIAVNLFARSMDRGEEQLTLALLSLKQNINNYIDSYVFSRMSPPLRHFFVAVSLLERHPTELLHKICDSEELLDEFKHQTDLLRYDFYLDRYSIHPMFIDYLRGLQDEILPEERHRIFSAAGSWCEEHGYEIDAVMYYEKSGEYDKLALIIYKMFALVDPDVAEALEPVFDRTPLEIILKTRYFAVMHLRVKLNLGKLWEAWDLARKYEELAAGFENVQHRAVLLASVYAGYAVTRQLLSVQDNVFNFDFYFKKIYEFSKIVPLKMFGPTTVYPVGAWANWAGSEKSGVLEENIEAIKRSIPFIKDPFVGYMYGLDNLAQGELMFYRYDLTSAEKYLQIAAAQAGSANQYDTLCRAQLYLLHIALMLGDLTKAEVYLAALTKLLGEKNYPIRYSMYDIALALFYLSLEKQKHVPAWLLGDFAKCKYGVYLARIINHTKLAIMFDAGSYAEIINYIEAAEDSEVALYGKIKLLTLKALSLYRLGAPEESMRTFLRVYELSQPNKIIQPFVELGKSMRSYMAFLLKEGTSEIPREWLESIRRKSATFAKRRSEMIAEYNRVNSDTRQVKLSQRERQVLSDLAAGLTRTEIAGKHDLSINTVKKIITSIYSKLGAKGLADAVRIAVEERLI